MENAQAMNHDLARQYADTVRYLMGALPMYQSCGAAAYKSTLATSLALDAHDGHPHQHYRTLHVAGTNGKGSVSHMLCAALMAQGYRVGLFTSPHLVDYRERIRVDGQMVSEAYVVQYVEARRALFEQLRPSFFEMSAALAFSYFAAQAVDFAVIEVGMGGRLDSTNVITPEVSVITNISYDHTAFLGHTLAAIAGEKAGIIKRGVPVVVGERSPETEPVFTARAEEMGAPLRFADHELRAVESECSRQGLRVVYSRADGTRLEARTDLRGEVQVQNVATALCAIEALRARGVELSESAVADGLLHVQARTGLRGRWQQVGDAPTIICDTGHNEAGLRRVMHQLEGLPGERLHMVMGFVNDKEVGTILPLLPRRAIYYWTQASVPRALPAGELAQAAHGAGLEGGVYPTVPEAVCAARRAAGDADVIFIGGSTFVVADALAEGGGLGLSSLADD